MWLAPNLPDEEEGKGEREGREFGRSCFRSASKTPKTETNHDNDSHETLFQTRASNTPYSTQSSSGCLCSFVILSSEMVT